MIPIFGAQYFGGCIDQSGLKVDVIDGCEPDYVTYNFYFTLYGSIGGCLSFLFTSFIGRLSDSFGRKIFLIIGILSWMIPRIILIFHINFFVYWTLVLFSEINGGDQFLPALKASISDIVSPDDRVNAFGKMHGSMGSGIIIGAVFAISVSSVWGNYTVLLVMAIWYIVSLIFTTFFIHETIDINDNRVPITKSVWKNPFRPLSVICYNKFLMLMSLIFCFASLVEAGIMSSIFGYIGFSLKLNEDGEASMVFGIYVTIVSLVLVPVSVFFLPWLKRKKLHYSNIIVIAVCFRIMSLLGLALISFDLNGYGQYVLYVSGVLYGAGLFNFAVLEGIVSEYVVKECSGTAFGVITSYKGIAGIIGPFSFGILFTELSDTNVSYMFIMLGIFMCVIQIILSLIPLKRLLNVIEPQSVQVRIKGENRNGERLKTADDDEDEDEGMVELQKYQHDNGILTMHTGDEKQQKLVLATDEDGDDEFD